MSVAQALILDSAVDKIEKVTGWTLTRQYSFPKLAFKVTPGVDRPSTVSFRPDPTEDTLPAGPMENSSSVSNIRHTASTSGQLPANSLVTELTADAAGKTSDQGKGSRSSGLKFPAAKCKQETAPIRSLPTGKGTLSQSRPGASIASSSMESDTNLMTAVATTRMEAVSLKAGVPRAAEGGATGVIQPKYNVVYRGQVDLSDAWEGPGATVAAAKHPKVNSWTKPVFACARMHSLPTNLHGVLPPADHMC